jgi:flagellar protein FlaJ
MALEFVPLFLAVGLVALAAAAAVFPSVSRRTDRLVLAVLASDERGGRDLRAAHISTPYRLYAARTRLYVGLIAVVTAVFGMYGVAGLLTVVDVTAYAPPETTFPISLPLVGLESLSLDDNAWYETAIVLGTASLLLGAIGGATTFLVRRYAPRSRAEARERRIDAGMTRTIAFVYALSRGGMAVPEVLRALSRNEGVYGESAREVDVAVRNMDMFGRDVVTALRHLAEQTPSDTFRVFSENLSSVLQSGQGLSDFLRDQYERYRDEARERQEEIVETIATVAEVYVTVVVAGMLFLITILIIIGLTTGDTVLYVQLSTYVVLPALNIVFIAYLAEATAPLRARREEGTEETEARAAVRTRMPIAPETTPVADGGVARAPETGLTGADRRRFENYQRLRTLRNVLRQPLESLLRDPEQLLYATVPLAAGYVAYELFPMAVGVEPFSLAAADDPVIGATVFVLGTFGVVYELHKRQLHQLESAVPEMLDRLASLNEAGVTVVGSFDRVRESDLGPMNEEAERIWQDIQWGATVSEALSRFEKRVQTPAITRMTTLVTNALRASNDIGPVLRIAAEQARSDRDFERSRRQEMFTYLVAIYVSFLVFLVVIGTIRVFFIPRLEQAAAEATQSGATATNQFLDLGGGQLDLYKMLLFHAAIVQAVLSGLVGGQMGEGSIKDGAKHAAIMVIVTYVVVESLKPFL